ncbi:MAG TPA: hypothetical protein VIK72_13175 [Clostridiaceae bacterium]
MAIKRLIAVVVTTLVVSSTLAGCGASKPTTNSTSTEKKSQVKYLSFEEAGAVIPHTGICAGCTG